MDSTNSPSTKPLFRSTQIVWAIVAILEIFLAFRFLLKLTGANAGAGFTSFIYALSWPLAVPFLTVFPTPNIQGSIFEWTTLLAMAVYGLVAWGLIELLTMSKTVSTPEAAAKLEGQRQ